MVGRALCIRQALGSIESAIRPELTEVGDCTLEELSERLPYYSWNQVFAVVDRLSRDGSVALQRPHSSGCIISLAPRRSAEVRHLTPVSIPSERNTSACHAASFSGTIFFDAYCR